VRHRLAAGDADGCLATAATSAVTAVGVAQTLEPAAADSRERRVDDCCEAYDGGSG